MKSIEIITKVENGKLKRNRSLIQKCIKSFEGKEVIIKISKKKKTRTTPQNSYYWGVVVSIFQNLLLDTWGEYYSIDQTHNFLKFNCNFIEKVNEETGEIVKVSKSTTENSTVDMEIYLASCRKLASEFFNYTIPEPNEDLRLEF